MKAKGFKNTDLMIGDLVEYRNVYLRIISLTGLHVMTEFGPYGLDEIEPISITPRILEKNGFQEETYGISHFNIYTQSDEYMGIKYDMNKHRAFFWKGNDVDVTLNIQYIHELQHALRLCGIDKEIVL